MFCKPAITLEAEVLLRQDFGSEQRVISAANGDFIVVACDREKRSARVVLIAQKLCPALEAFYKGEIL